MYLSSFNRILQRHNPLIVQIMIDYRETTLEYSDCIAYKGVRLPLQKNNIFFMTLNCNLMGKLQVWISKNVENSFITITLTPTLIRSNSTLYCAIYESNYHHHHHVVLIARISLIFSRHSSLSTLSAGLLCYILNQYKTIEDGFRLLALTMLVRVKGPQEYIAYELSLSSPIVSRMS